MQTHAARTSNKRSFSRSGEDLWQWAQRSETSEKAAEVEQASLIAGWARALLWLRSIASREPKKTGIRHRRGF